MPIIITVIAIVVIGAGAYLWSTQATAPVTRPDITATEELIEVAETIPATDEVPTPDPTDTPDDTLVIEEPTTDESAIAPEPPSATVVTESIDVSYLTPARTSHDMTVTLTVADGIVTDASIIYDNGDGFSNAHQERFDGAYKAQVIGQPIDGIALSRVGGASLTTGAFNDAAAQIAARL
jgi:hypothetical protein